MDSLFATLLERLAWTSAQSALLVGALLLLVRVLPKLPAATRCTLWWLVGMQAVIGLAWASPLELQVLPARPSAVVVSDVQASPTALSAGATQEQQGAAFAAIDAATPLRAPAMQPATALGAAWLLGVLLMVGWTLRGYCQSRRLVRDATPCEDRTLCAALQLAADAHGLRRAPRLMLSAQIDSPQLIGPWRPVLLLPARQLPTLQGDALDMALTHELVHLQRRDLWLGLVPSLAQHLFFFHPLVHFAAREYAVQREIACDAAVVAGHRHCRQDYGRLLVQLGVSPRSVVGVASASPTYLSLKRRLQMLQHAGSFPRVASLLVIAAVATAGVAPLRLVAADVPSAAAPSAAPAVTRPAASAAPHAQPLPAPAVLPADAPYGVLAPAAPPRPRTPLTPGTPPSPPPPPTAPPPAVPAPPTAPVPPAPPHGGIITHGRLDLSKRPAQAFVLVNKDDNFVDGSLDDIRQAQRDARGEQVLWVRRNDQRYVIRDPQALAQVRRDYAEVAALGRKQAEQGRHHAVAASAAAVRAQQAAIAADAAAAAQEAVATLDVDAIRADAAAAVREAGVARIAAQAAREEAAVARRDVAQQADLAAQQERASARARSTVDAVINAAIDSGRAQRLD